MMNPIQGFNSSRREDRRRAGLVLALAGFVLGLALSLAAYAGIVMYIRQSGIRLVPVTDHPVTVQRFDLQNDPRWSSDEIGASGRQMAGTGCLITSVATAISSLGVPTDPKTLNRLLTQNGGYQGADLLWYKIHTVIPAVDYRYERIFSSRTIESDLEAGRLPIVNVKFHKTGYTHWVLIAGARDGDFLILDPLGDGLTPMRLSEHGKVYTYRVIRKADDLG